MYFLQYSNTDKARNNHHTDPRALFIHSMDHTQQQFSLVRSVVSIINKQRRNDR